jgi:hypothetical protein
MLLGGLIGLVASADRAVSLQKLASIGLAALVFGAMSRLGDKGRRQVAWLIVGAGLLVSLAGNVLIDRNAWKLNALNRPVYAAFAHIPRFSDLAMNQNALAAFLVLAIPFGAALARAGRLCWPARALTAALGFELLLTDSRAAVLSLALAASVAGMYMRSRWRWLWLAPAVLAIGAVVGGAFGTPSTGERLAIWQSALYMLADHPLTGVGLGMFQRVYPDYMLPAFHNTQPHAHNLLLQAWLDMGVLGAMGIAGLVTLTIAAIARLARAPDRQPLASAAAVSSAAVLLHAQVDSYFAGDPRTYWVMFIPLAMLLSGAGSFTMPKQAWAAIAAPLLLVPISQANWVAERRMGLRTGKAIYFQDALRDGPKTELAHFELAQALFASGDEPGAIQQWRLAKAAPYLVRHGMYDLALAVDPNDPEAREGWLWTPVRPVLPLDQAGRAAELAGDDAGAERQYLALSTLDPVGYYRLAELNARHGEAGAAVAELEQAVQAIPNQEDFRLALARAYRETGQAVRASEEYAAVLDLDPGNRDAAASLARATGPSQAAV